MSVLFLFYGYVILSLSPKIFFSLPKKMALDLEAKVRLCQNIVISAPFDIMLRKGKNKFDFFLS